MTSTSIFTKNRFLGYVEALDPAWKFALGTFVAARLWFLIWPFVISLLVPVAVQNLNLSGKPVLAAFDLGSSARYVYSRELDVTILRFRAGERGYVTDEQTGSVWSLREGQAQTGPYSGRVLEPSAYSAEEVFPYYGVAAEPNPLLAIWQRFDTNWYLRLAERGYSPGDGSTVYFPLYPLLIRVTGSLLFGHDLLAALLVSNLSLVGALYFLYRLAQDLNGPSGARRALVYLALFPTAFFLFAAYTESLFLCLSLAALCAGHRGRWLWAVVLGSLAALTRLQGIVLFLPLAYMWWKQVAGSRWQVAGRRLAVSCFTGDALRGAALLLIPLATLAFLAVTNLSLLTRYQGQLHARFVLPWDNLLASLELIAQNAASAVDILNLAVTIIFATMCAVVWVKLPREYGLYAVGMLLAPLFRMTTQQPLVSMTRYALVVFPVFILWAAWGKHPWVNRAVIYLSLPLNLYLSAQFFMWGWVA
jgi:hypothetical protein